MTGTSTIAAALLSAAITIGLAAPVDAEPPRGSITIERIADIKYPTNPAWSPDGHRVAFLWDAAGKQDLFVVAPGGKPVPLTDFAVDPDLLQSDLGAFAWASNDDILFGRNGQLWKVSASNGAPARMTGALADAGAFALSPDRKTIGFLRRGQIWLGNIAAGTERQLTNLPDGLAPGVAGVLRGRPLAGVQRIARRARARGPALERPDGALDGERHRGSAGSA